MNNERHNPPYHLLMVTNTLAAGGAENMLIELASALNPQIVRPVVICLKEAGPRADALTERSIPIHENQLKHKYDWRAAGRLAQLIKLYEPACIMAVGSGGDRMFWSALAARQAKVPAIVWSHIFPTPGHTYFEWLNRRLYGHISAFVALGRRHKQALIELEKIPADRLHIIRNGINVAKFERPDLRLRAREMLGIKDEDTVAVGIIANLRSDKRHDIFIEAAGRTRARRNGCQFVIVGDGPMRAKVDNLVAKQDPNGSFIKPLGQRDDPATLLQSLDVVCLTSEWHECLSITMLEAMAAGKAFVAPRIGSLDEALIDGETGCFFEPLSAEALTEVLIDLIDRPDRRQALGLAAQAKVREEFTADLTARGFETLITNLCRDQV